MIHYAWVIAFTGTLVTVLAHGFGRMSYSVILPSMKDGLSLTYTQLGSIATGNFIGYLSLAIIGGFLAARFGVRRVVCIASCIRNQFVSHRFFPILHICLLYEANLRAWKWWELCSYNGASCSVVCHEKERSCNRYCICWNWFRFVSIWYNIASRYLCLW